VARRIVSVRSKGIRGMGLSIYGAQPLKGKSYTKNLTLGPQVQKYKEEIGNYHQFQRLCEKIIGINEEICNLQPVAQIEDTNKLE
jgi:hypothetical protein